MTVAALCVTTGGLWALNNQKEFQAAARTVQEAILEFLNEHMIEPIQYVHTRGEEIREGTVS